MIHVILPRNPLPDYSTVSALRQTGFAILQSTSLQEVQDLALVSHSLALHSGKGVLHFSEASQNDVPIPRESLGVVQSLLRDKSAFEGGLTKSSMRSVYRRDHEEQGALAETEITQNHASTDGGNPDGFNGKRALLPNASTSYNSDEAEEDTLISTLTHDIFTHLKASTGRQYRIFEYFGPPDAHSAILVFGSSSVSFKVLLNEAKPSDSYYGVGLIQIRLYRPWLDTVFWSVIPKSLKVAGVVEQLRHRPTKWGPMFMDVLSSVQGHTDRSLNLVSYQLGQLDPDAVIATLREIAINLQLDNPPQNIIVGQPFLSHCESKLEQPHLENAYVRVLQQLFGEKLNILNANASNTSPVASEISSTPEYLLGGYLARLERRNQLVSEVTTAVREGQIWQGRINDLMSDWVAETAKGSFMDEGSVSEILRSLHKQDDSLSKQLRSDPWLFNCEVPWIIGSEAWAFDLGASGVHHLLAAGKNVNMLIIDSQHYFQKREELLENRKKDIGLYAMNFGNAYVASVALYSSYTQVMHAMAEAQKFNGPSIVLAYLPYASELDSPLQLLQETKIAVNSGYWPLYRWTPASTPNGDPIFQLDSERVKKELKAFIDRENHLTHLVRGAVDISTTISQSHGSELRHHRKVRAKEAVEKLMDGLSGPAVSILFASDGGNAENMAKRIGRRGKARGLKPKILAMDDFPVEDLPNEKNVIFCTSTAGQGEFPQNGREMWDGLKNSTDIDLSRVNFAIFALGDSHYWPRKEDRIYYNKPGKDLDARLEALGGKRLIPVGLGDDQDPDGYETGYGAWEPQLWKALGVDKVDTDFEEPKPLTNEDIKIASNFLRGTIAEGLADTSTGAISESDAQLTKFHGIYMQDDRDLRDQRKAQGLEPAYIFMVRVRMSAGVCQPEQWIAMDRISDKWGNKTFKLVSYLSYPMLIDVVDDKANISISWVTTFSSSFDVY